MTKPTGRPNGRPPKYGDRTPVLVRFPPEDLAPVEMLALTTGQDRQVVILDLIQKGLKAHGRKKA